MGMGSEETMGLADDDGVEDIEHSFDDNYEDDDKHFLGSASETDPYTNTNINILEPYEGMEFESLDSAKALYNSYARRLGFNTRVRMSRRNRRDGLIIQRSFVCAKEGFHAFNHNNNKRPRAVNRVGCKAGMVVKIQDNKDKWVVSAFLKEHNHDLLPSDKLHSLRSHSQLSTSVKSLIDTLQAAGVGPSGIMSALIVEFGGLKNVGFTERDCRKYMRSSKLRTLGGDTQVFLDYLKENNLENPSFSYSVQGDDERFMSNIFWADPKAKLNYSYFGDTVTFDTTYKRNRYRLPLVPVTGVNHHGQPVLFGCALLINESEASFVWLFKTWLAAMAGRPPVSITTDHDRVIQLAVKQVFPFTRHRFCKWHIFKECGEKLSHVLSEHPNFEAELHKCVSFTQSVEEFESCWLSLIDRYNLSGNEWLQSVYAVRELWVPVYFRDTFFAEMSVTKSSDSMNSYFDRYVNASTTLHQFVKLYEKAIESRYEKEVKADYETINTAPVLRTPSPMEKQAAVFYTRKLFVKFQEELVETLTFSATKLQDEKASTTYRVSKFGETHNSCFVRHNAREMKATCSCQMFQFSGMLCRHILTVFRVANVLTLPPRYILKRWTRNAKSGLMLEELPSDLLNSFHETLSFRYNNLRHEALKYVDEGVKTVEIYNVAMDALREAKNKVTIAQKNGGRIGSVSRTSKGISENNNSQGDHQPGLGQPQSTDEQDRKIQKLSLQLELSQQNCEVYRDNLLSVLKDIEQQKLQLIVKAHNIKLAANQFSPEFLECVKEDITHLNRQQAILEQVLTSVGNQPISFIPPPSDVPFAAPIMLRRNLDNVHFPQLKKAAKDEAVGPSNHRSKRKRALLAKRAHASKRVEPTYQAHERGTIGEQEGTSCSFDGENTRATTQVKDGSSDSFTGFVSPRDPSLGVMEERLVAAATLLDSPSALNSENLPMEPLSNEILRSSSLEALEKLEAVIREWGSRSSSNGETLAQLKTQVDSSEKRAHLAETELLTLRQFHEKIIEGASSHQKKLVEVQFQLTTAIDKLAGEIARREAAETERERLKKVHTEEVESLTTELGLMKARAKEAEKKATDDLQKAELAANQVVGLEERLDREFGLGFFSGYRDLRERAHAEHPDWDLSSYDPLQSSVWERDT